MTIGRGTGLKCGEMSQMATGGIAIEPLNEEQMHGGNGIEKALPPLTAEIVARLQNCLGLELCGPLLLELTEDLG